MIKTADRLLDRSPALACRDDSQNAPNATALPETALLLTGGGDTRIVLDPRSAANKYGCPPLPAPAFAAFGSSTASTISAGAFAAADRLRTRLVHAAGGEPASVTYGRELQRMRRELRALCGLSELSGPDIIFGASGTDLHLIAAQLVGYAGDQPAVIVMVEAAETGSGVPAAMAGRYFSAVAPLGDELIEGTPALAGVAKIVAVPARNADGSARRPEAIDGDVVAIVDEAAAGGCQVLVTMVDVSKTGMIAPGPACAVALHRRWPEQVQVLVDACQFRLAPATLRAYLASDCILALTGSKFVTGPAFSGALLIPDAIARRLRHRALPSALRAFSARAEWPHLWPAAQSLRDDAANYGLLLRWEAALHELRAFRAVPEPAVADILRRFAGAVEARLGSDPAFERLPTPTLDRGVFGPMESWDRIPTIFPFLLRHIGPRMRPALLNRDETTRLHQWLATDASERLGLSAADPARAIAAQPCQIGQPVPCGHRAGVPIAALRLCASARLVVEAAALGPAGADMLINRAMQVLDKTALLAHRLPRIGVPAASLVGGGRTEVIVGGTAA